ncbi:MAG: hypothetical protein QN158_13465 [Armatimonadota bacterium]|nr:hypothetical protein [Armatimonadota bacterium]MDR7447964.1 hypothetical protein [Armatimonadota bacterium]MDR7458228.1 hypothetical protein [Armatimonadota bacterium]MDR7478467.1 hypothetical protein [Armatimonadota bacterium]MDR7487401.1 hypothetical protein [Armatimonadota bacterium]
MAERQDDPMRLWVGTWTADDARKQAEERPQPRRKAVDPVEPADDRRA